jgi:predicted DCC family thiol-disulfide oxidoreductase YuxK
MPARIEPPPASSTLRSDRASVVYDGHCALCRKSVALLQRLDWLGVLSYVNARDSESVSRLSLSVGNGRLLEEMHLLTPGGARLLSGFRAFRWMAWRLPLLWVLAPFLYLPGVPALGQRLYLWVARNRFRLVPCHGGVCTIQKD